MKLSRLTDRLSGLAPSMLPSSVDPDVTAICYDSRQVSPGALFVAIEGFVTDGHDFIGDAVDKGAVAVVCRQSIEVDAVMLPVADPRAALAHLAGRFYRHPAEQLILAGVTGTSGKTTVTYLLEQILEAAGHRPGVIGTIDYRHGGQHFANPVTTPESADLQAILRSMADDGVSHVVMEVSSHALDLHRVGGCHYDAAVFTNLSHDHLDYHGSMDNYWRSKKKLFERHLKPVAADRPLRAVINTDDAYGRELAHSLGPAALRTAADGAGDVVPRQVIRDSAGLRGQIDTPHGPIALDSALVGDFNLENILSAAGAALALGISPAAIAAGITACRSVPGRLERIRGGGDRFVFVDYSHKPDALENAIESLKKLSKGRLITVFGCGGDRDRAKRPLMGHIAARLSDLTVVTSDNPRSEDPLAIIDQVEVGVRQACTRRLTADSLASGWQPKAYLVEPDRMAAITAAIHAARTSDTVLIAGKGHETYQVLAAETIHFDDREAARRVLADNHPMGA